MGRPARFPTKRPTEAEQAAQRWHKQWHPRGGKIWYSCNACEKANPHYAVASRYKHADVFARIRQAIMNARPPDGERRR